MTGPDVPNILIVDDTPDNLRLLAGILGEAGYRVRPARDGRSALSSAAAKPPDLIMLDIMMPDLDGFQVCAAFKADETTRDVPVIFLSALSETFDKVKAFSAGGVDYITKPFQEEEVLARVGVHLALRRKSRELDRQLKEKEAVILELQKALSEIKTLRGLLPICANCKKIRDDQGYWRRIETYLQEHTGAELTHGLCPDCIKSLYPEVADKILSEPGQSCPSK